MNLLQRMFLTVVMFFKKNDECKEILCNGKINKECETPLMTGCTSAENTYPCSKCGRLHWGKLGGPVFSKSGEKAFISPEGQVFHKK